MTALIIALALGASAEPADPVMGTVVTSKEWTVRRGAQKEEEFSGDVRYHAGPDAVAADWALYQHAAKRWHAKGAISVRHQEPSGDVFIAHGDEAFLNDETKSGQMSAKEGVRFERQAAEGGVDYGQAGKASWQGTRSVALGNEVHLWGPRLESWSNQADYEAGKLTLTGGRPAVRKFVLPDSAWTGALKADVIVATRADRKVSADGKAAGWLIFPARAQERKKAPKS